MLALDITIQFSDLWAVLATIVFIVVMSSVSSRLLGVRSKRWRSFLASALGWIIGLAAGGTIAKHRSLDEFYTVAALFAVLATMTLMIVIDVVFQPRAPRSGRRRRRNLLHPLRWVRLKLSPVGRFRQVLRYARKRQLARLEFMSAGAIGTKEFGRRLRLTLEDAGGMFVKFGQIASTRTDLLAEPVVEELSQLRAAVRPIPPDELRALIEDELGRPVEEVFTSFTWEPMAAASIGQAHRASLPGGEEVVVKIQRPGLDELLGRDATVLRFAAAMAERRVEAARRLGLRALAEELILGMERELDYGREATMSKRLAAELEFDGAIAIPAVFDEVSTSRLLVMEEARGKSVDDPLAVSLGGVLPDDLARSLLRSFMAQVLGGGAYHADPHPGNVLIDETGKLWLLDFGAVGLLDATSRESLQEMALGMTLNEPLMVARAVRRLA
ncbi:MAG: ABC1 kinase family protein, partial [Acidimicrobiales bacterium]